MNAEDLRSVQAPLKERYREAPIFGSGTNWNALSHWKKTSTARTWRSSEIALTNDRRQSWSRRDRTTFWDAVADYVAGKATRQQAASRIAGRFREWVAMFENARTQQAQAM